jgi:hypothetical protein
MLLHLHAVGYAALKRDKWIILESKIDREKMEQKVVVNAWLI